MKLHTMYEYRTLSKSQLIELVNIIESQLASATQSSKEAAEKYSTELPSRLAFEVGHLNGYIKNVLATIEEYKKYSK